MGIVLGKYLVFDEGGSLESRMASMTVEQIHAFRLSMLENTLEPYKYLIMVLMCVLFLFMLTRFPTVNPRPYSAARRRAWEKPCAIWQPTAGFVVA